MLNKSGKQSLFGLGIGGTGIVAVLIVAGILLYYFNVNTDASKVAIWAGIIIGIILVVFGVISVLISLFKRTLGNFWAFIFSPIYMINNLS